MTENHDEPGGEGAPEEPTEGSADPLYDRRQAIAKAAIGAGVAGAAFLAPRVEGLSLVPDFAAAGTYVGTASANFDDSLPCWGQADYFSQSSRTVPTPGGNFTVSIPGNQQADSGASIPVNVSFSMDPPHNRLLSAGLVFRGRNAPGGKNGPHGPVPLASFGVAFPQPTQVPISFVVPEGTNNVGPSPTGNTQWGDLTFNFTFG